MDEQVRKPGLANHGNFSCMFARFFPHSNHSCLFSLGADSLSWRRSGGLFCCFRVKEWASRCLLLCYPFSLSFPLVVTGQALAVLVSHDLLALFRVGRKKHRSLNSPFGSICQRASPEPPSQGARPCFHLSPWPRARPLSPPSSCSSHWPRPTTSMCTREWRLPCRRRASVADVARAQWNAVGKQPATAVGFGGSDDQPQVHRWVDARSVGADQDAFYSPHSRSA